MSYAVPRPAYYDPLKWLDRIRFITGVFESEAKPDAVFAFYHIHFKGVIQKNRVTYHFTNYRRWQLVLPFAFHKQVRRVDPDAIVVHGLIFPLQVLLLRLALGPKVTIVVQHHAERPFRDFRKYLQRWADRYITAYLFSSMEMGRWWVERHQISSMEKIKEVMGTSSGFYPIERQEARKITNVTGKTVYLWVGGLDENKDPLVVVRAFSRLIHESPGAMLYMIYQTNDLLENLEALVTSLNLNEHVKLVGKVEHGQLQYWYNSADFIISSSHYEGSGIAVCEALSCGCIPIVTDIPSFRMMTANGAIGFLYPAGDDEALFATLVRSLVTDIAVESGRVVSQFQRELSFEANAKKIRLILNR